MGSFVDITTLRDPTAQPGRPFTDDLVIRSDSGNYREDIQGIFKEILQVPNDRVFQKIWNQAKFVKKITWNEKDPITLGTFRKIEQALRETLVFRGKGIQPEERGGHVHVHEILRYLLGRNPRVSVDKAFIHNFIMKGDPALLIAAQDELRVVLRCCANELPVPGTPREKIFQAYVGNLLALLPFFYPNEGEVFSIPQKIDGVWRVLPYKVDKKLELTPRWFSTPITALGFTSPDGPPLLAFIGTTFPAGDGFVATLLSDFTPGLSVGHAPYLTGKKAITDWLEDKENVRLYGMSLGGALALQTLRHHGEKISQVHAYNAAGLYPWNWNGFNSKAEVDVYYQDNDLVATLGTFPKHMKANIYRVIPEVKEGFLKAHARVYSGSDTVTLIKTDPRSENQRFVRKLLIALHLVASLFIFTTILTIHFLYQLMHKTLQLFSKPQLPQRSLTSSEIELTNLSSDIL